MKVYFLLSLFLFFVITAFTNAEKVNFFSIEKETFYNSYVENQSPSFDKKNSFVNCPNNCGGSTHGSCVNGICRCNSGWSGEDCSIQLQSLTANVPLRNQHVDYRTWSYYTISLPANKGLAFEVNSTGSGDCDLFEKLNSLPSLHDYDQRDISTSSNSHLEVRTSGAGNYYLGVFGFTACDYSVEAVTSNNCPNGCSGHGTCNDHTSVPTCECSSGWAGIDCSERVQSLQNFVPVSSSAQTGEWKYFSYNLDQNYDVIAVLVNQTSTTGDVDLYMRYEKLPNQTFWDYRDNGISKNYALVIDAPRHGIWYLGLYAFQSVLFNVTVVPYSDCTNDCSEHGTCAQNGCACNRGFTGRYCETMASALNDFQRVTGFVGDDTWNYYHYTSTTTNNIVVSVNQTREESNADCDVYVRAGSNPDFENFDYSSINFENEIKIIIEDGQMTTWYIGIFGFSSCHYAISVGPSVACIPGCTAHGSCLSDGSCRCNEGYAGEACDIQVDTISSNQLVTDSVGNNKWHYYQLKNVNSTYISVHLHEENSIGFIWLFVSVETYPSLLDHDWDDKETNTDYHVLEIETGLSPNEKQDFYIGVYGNPFIEEGNADYKLQVWVPPF